MAFTAKILSWPLRHLNIIGCLLKRRPSKGGHRHPRTPLSYAPDSNVLLRFRAIPTQLSKFNCFYFVVNFSMPMILLCLLMRSSTWGRQVVWSRGSCFLITDDMAVRSSQT